MKPINSVVGLATLTKWYGIPRHKLRKLIQSGQLEAKKVGNTWIVDSIAMLDYIATLSDDEQHSAGKSFIQAGRDLVSPL